MSAYSNQLTFMFTPFSFDAATLSIAVVRPFDNNAAAREFTTTLSLTRTVAIGTLATRVVENAKTCGFSLVDYFMAENPPPMEEAVVC